MLAEIVDRQVCILCLFNSFELKQKRVSNGRDQAIRYNAHL